MNRYFLGLTGGIALIAIGASPAPISANYQNAQSVSTNVQTQDEISQLEKRVATYVIGGKRIATSLPNFLSEYHKGGGADFLDKITGKDMKEEVIQRMGKLYETDPEKVQGKNPGDIFSDIVQHVYDLDYFRIDGGDFTASAEVKVYYRDGNYQDLNWNDPKNYFKLTWTDSQWENMFTDNGIDGIADESSTPVITNRQQDFLQYLQRIEDIFLKGV